jgi:O-acetyl-ADP-ribose deacetylase (regulator of RNase III)
LLSRALSHESTDVAQFVPRAFVLSLFLHDVLAFWRLERRYNGSTMSLSAIQADITTLRVDAIVNAANERMLGGGGVDGAIHRAAGPQLYQACLKVPEVTPGVRCPTGEARITPGFELPARFVIHTVGPVWDGGTFGEAELLANCYRSSLQLAADNGVKSIAFPAISTGVYGYPSEQAAAIAVRETREFLSAGTSVERIIFACFDGKTLAIYQSLLSNT